jgi:large subunit ribosomal protein L25
MSTVLVADTGRSTGSPAARRMRRDDRIPAVVYGQGMQPITVSVVRRDLRIALSGPAGVNTVLDLTVEGKVYPAIVKELQRHPVRRNVSHVDFLQVNLNEEITISIPIRLEGEAKEVIAAGGLVDPAVDSVDVRTTPRNIPDEIVIDVSDMTMDTVITLGDITMPSGVTAIAEPDTPLVTVLTIRADELESDAVPAAEEGEGEGEAAEGEGGEGAADGGEASEPAADSGE